MTIIPTTPLPVIANPTNVDGTTQPGFGGSPIVEINGSQIFFPIDPKDPGNPPAGTQIPGINGLAFTAGSSTLRGLVINRFTGNGVVTLGGSNDKIAGNYIGTDLSGTVGLGNGEYGIVMAGTRNSVIGGVTGADRNVISDNTFSGINLTNGTSGGVAGNNVVEGNFIGTASDGVTDLGNQYDGVTVNTNTNVIGGLAPGAGNVIAFNGNEGVHVFNFFSNTRIGTAVLSNKLFDNTNQDLDLSFGTFNPVPGGVLTSAFQSDGTTVVQGRFSAAPDTTYGLQFFSNPGPAFSGSGGGMALAGSGTATTDDNGNAKFSVAVPTVELNKSLSALATDPGNNTSTFFRNTRVVAAAAADLGVSQSVDPSSALTGDKLTYTVNYTNNGPSIATGVVLTDTLPPGMNYGSAKATAGTVAAANGVVTVSLPKLFPGETEGVTIEVTATVVETAENVATVRADQNDPNPANDTSTLDTPITANPLPPVVVAYQPMVGLHSINGVVLTFSQPLDPLQATNPINYSLVLTGPHGRQTNVAIEPVVYDSKALTIKITPVKPLSLGKSYKLILNGQGSAGIDSVSGNLLLGNTSLYPGGPYVIPVNRGYVPKTPPASKGRGGHQVRLVEATTHRRVLTVPVAVANNPNGSTFVAQLPGPLA